MDWLFVFSQAFTYGHIKGERERERESIEPVQDGKERVYGTCSRRERERKREKERERERERTLPQKSGLA